MLGLNPILRLAIVLCLFVVWSAAGCASSGSPAPGADAEALSASAVAPAGLSVRAEVYVRDRIAAARFSPGVYLLEPDGTLRVGGAHQREMGQPMPSMARYPPILRRLAPSEVNRVWRLIGGTTLADPASPERIQPTEDWAPLPDRSIVLVHIRDHNGTRRFAVSLSGATPAAAAAQALVERLQALAWKTPQPVTPIGATGS